MDSSAVDLDQRVRLAAFRFLTQQTQLHGEVLSRTILVAGFTFEGTRVPLLGPQGIFKPAILREIPLSIDVGVMGNPWMAIPLMSLNPARTRAVFRRKLWHRNYD